MWFYISDWQTRLGEKKDLLVRGTGKNAQTISLAPYENNIEIEISTYPAKGSSETKHTDNPNCTISNFPLQRWVNLIISLNVRTLDVYLDGKLVRTCILPSVAMVNPDDPVQITTNGGFDGWTSNLEYFAKPLNPQQAYDIYKKGYGGGCILGLFEKYKIKVAYLVDNKEEGSLEI